MIRFLSLLLVACILSACAHAPPPAITGCQLTAYPLLVSPNHPRTINSQGEPDPPEIAEVLRRALAARPSPGDASGSTGLPQVLVLSGGGQNGAFGVGFLRGLRPLPTYRVVTGVSTGALQSTFAFLANQPVPGDRTYQAHMLDEIVKPGHSNVDDLFLAYGISNEGDLIDVGSFGVVGVAVRGAVGKFGPLRDMGRGLISDETIAAVKGEHKKGRLLLVGVVNVTDGQGYAVDLTELASRLDLTMSANQIRKCYVEAVLASASVPLAVPPITLEVKSGTSVTFDLYIDGGARFGVFWEQLRKVTDTQSPADITAIVNGKFYSEGWLVEGKKVEKWSAINLGLRAVSILENQVYRFSVNELERSVRPPGSLKLAFISNHNLPGEIEPDNFTHNGRTCRDWAVEDVRRSHPTEFHPLFMRCLIAYGEYRGEARQWNLELPRPKGSRKGKRTW